MNAPSGLLLRHEFERAAILALRATRELPDPELSVRVSNVWTMRSRTGAVLCEVCGDSVLENSFDLDITLLERIGDLRAFGMSSRAILGWFGVDTPNDPLRDAQEALAICMRCR